MRALLVEDVVKTLTGESLLDILKNCRVVVRQGVATAETRHSESSGLVGSGEKLQWNAGGMSSALVTLLYLGKKSLFPFSQPLDFREPQQKLTFRGPAGLLMRHRGTS